MKFAVKQNGHSVAGLDAVTIDNANLRRIAPDSPLHYLAVGEHTWGIDSMKERYFIIRVE